MYVRNSSKIGCTQLNAFFIEIEMLILMKKTNEQTRGENDMSCAFDTWIESVNLQKNCISLFSGVLFFLKNQELVNHSLTSSG